MKLNISPKRKELFIKTIVWKQMVAYFLEKNGVDITDQLISVQVQQKKITIKVKGSVLKQDFILHEPYFRDSLTVFFKSIGQDVATYKFTCR